MPGTFDVMVVFNDGTVRAIAIAVGTFEAAELVRSLMHTRSNSQPWQAIHVTLSLPPAPGPF